MLPLGTRCVWVFMVLLLLCSIHSLLAAPIQPGSEQSAEAPSKPNMTMKGVFESFLSFFSPITCRLSNERLLTPCPVEGLNMSECSEIHCCPFKIGQEEQCYMPVRDDVQLAIRVVLLTGGGFLVLGFLPFCCCALLQRSPCINPLQKISKKVQKIAREKRAADQKSHDEEIHRHLLD